MEVLRRLFSALLVLSICEVGDFREYEQSVSIANNANDSSENTIQKNVEKPRTLYDYQTRVVAYKDLIDSKCLLEILSNEESIISQRLANAENRTRVQKPISTTNQLSKREIWRLAGTRILDFCRGFPTYLIQNNLPQDTQSIDPNSYMQNDLPFVQIANKRCRKRDATYYHIKKFRGHQVNPEPLRFNIKKGKYQPLEKFNKRRRKRDNRRYFVGKVRGQTQSQYLSFGNNGGQPGKAEAESSLEGTKAVVSGSSGMGQAQSQSSSVDCGECLGPGFQDQGLYYARGPGELVPEKIMRPEYPEYSRTPPGERYPETRTPEDRWGLPGEGGGGYPPSAGRPSGTYQPGAKRPGEVVEYPPGAERPEVYPPGVGRPGEVAGGYPPGTRGPEEARYRPGATPGGIEYPPGAETPRVFPPGVRRPGEVVGGFAQGTRGPEDTGYRPGARRPGEGAEYPPGAERPGVYPPGVSGPGFPPGTSGPEAGFRPGTGRPGERVEYPPGAERPGYPPGVGRPGEVAGRYPSGTRGPEEAEYRPGGRRPGDGVEYPPGAVRPGMFPSGVGNPGEVASGYPPSSGRPEAAPGVERPGEYPPGASRPEEPGYKPAAKRPGEGVEYPNGYPSGARRPEGEAYRPAAGRPGEIGGYPLSGPGEVARRPPGAGVIYPPGEGGVIYPPSGRPGDGAYLPTGERPGVPGYPPGIRRPEQGGPGYTGARRPGEVIPGGEKPGAGKPGEETGRPAGEGAYYPQTGGGTFGGALSGQYQGHAGQSGKFSGTFQGTYETDGYKPGAYPSGYSEPGQWIDGKWVPSGGVGPSSYKPSYQGPPRYEERPPGGAPQGPPAYEVTREPPGGPPTYGPSTPETSGLPSGAYVPGGRPTDGGGPSYQPPGGRYPPPGQYIEGNPVEGAGKWIDGKWVPARGAGAGQWIDGKWVSIGGPPGGAAAGQWVDGKWVPAGVPPGGAGQWTDGKWVPAGGPPDGAGAGQWVDGKWVPSGGPPVSAEAGQWVNGKWVPQIISVGPPGGAGAGPPGGAGAGQWVNGKWVPTGGPPGGGGSAGQWVDGKWTPTGGPPGGAGAGSPSATGAGQWIDGKWVPAGAPPAGAGAGQWVDGKWVPAAGPSGAVGTGPSGGAGADQWVDGRWVPAGEAVAGAGQWIDGKWVPAGGPPGGAGAWVDGKWVPAGGPPGTAGTGPSGSAGAGQWIDGRWVPAGEAVTGTGAGQWVDGKWVPAAGVSDDADSQVQTSVQQANNETVASAQAQGRFQGGTAQSQVTGTYSGSGSFSASAGSDDGKRGALTQVSGGQSGASSSAQGRGGAGQSQAQVELDSATGDTKSSAQSSGVQHGTQTQVSASEKGGLADAQANGPGATSSQAQIGFAPYDDSEKDNNQTVPFGGGGTAAAQSGTHSGMTQTQIQGKFRYGIRYQGAAQAGSGATAIRNLTEPTGFFKPLNFTATRVSHNKRSQSQQASIGTARDDPVQKKTSASVPPRTLTPSGTSREVQKIDPVSQEDPVVDTQTEPPTMDYEDPEYADEDYDYKTSQERHPEPIVTSGAPSRRNLELPVTKRSGTSEIKPPSIITQTGDHQKQHIVLDPLENLDATVHQSEGEFPVDGMVLQPGQIIPGSPGYQIPAGFRGKVKAIANGPNTYTIGKNSQAQSVKLSPGSGRIIYSSPSKPIYGVITKTTYKNGNYGAGYSYQPIYQPVSYRMKSGKVLPNFVSVSKSEAGERDLKTGQKTPNVYYTQSSSCGMFTNSCVYANGKKTCFPVRKTNPDGTPMSC